MVLNKIIKLNIPEYTRLELINYANYEPILIL
jgi:hypothetical protein